MNHSYISSRAMVAQIQNEFGLTSHTNKLNMINYVGNAIEYMGYGAGFETKYIKRKVKDFKVNKPVELINLYNVFYKGAQIRNAATKRFSKNHEWDFFENHAVEELQNEILSRVKAAGERCELPECVVQYNCCEDKDALIDDILKINETKAFLDDIKKVRTLSYSQENWYKDTPHCIKTNIQEGEVTLQYLAFSVDEEGFPLVLNKPKYKEFVKLYVMKTLLLSGIKHKVLNFRDLYNLTEEAEAKARNEEIRLNSKQMELLISSWANIRQ